MARPESVINAARPNTSESTSRRCAPSAIRIPISAGSLQDCLGHHSENANRRQQQANPANADSNHALTRVRHIASPTRSSIVLISLSGTVESSSLTSRAMEETRVFVSSWVRTNSRIRVWYD